MFTEIFLATTLTIPQIRGGEKHGDNGKEYSFFYSTVSLGSGSCSGSLIAPKVVLTAAHCVGSSARNIRISYGKNASWNKSIGAIRVIKHPQYIFKRVGGGDYTKNDLALIFLKEELPKPFRPAPLLRKPFSNNNLVWNAGYGWRGPNYGSGSFRRLKSKITNYSRDGKITTYALKQRTGTCSGDSGSPLYDWNPKNDLYYVLGALSTSSVGVRGRSGHCGRRSNYTLIGPHIESWVIPTINEIMPGQRLVDPSELVEPEPEPIEPDEPTLPPEDIPIIPDDELPDSEIPLPPPPEMQEGPFTADELEMCYTIAKLDACHSEAWPIAFYKTIRELLDYRLK